MSEQSHRSRPGRPHRPQPAARLHLRRQALRGLCRRHARLGPARQWRASRRAQLQIPPPARHHDRRLRGAQRADPAAHAATAPSPIIRATQIELYDGPGRREPEPLAVAALRHRRRQQSAVALFPGGLLLQDLHVAAQRLDEIRACHPPRRRPRQGARRRPIPTATSKTYAHCDVLVVGAGPRASSPRWPPAPPARGSSWPMSRPSSAARCCRAASPIDGKPASDWLAEAVAALARMPEVTLLPRTTAFGYYDHNYLDLDGAGRRSSAAPPPHAPRQRLWRVRAKQVVLATGAIERPLVFADNDRPGVMLASAAADLCPALWRAARPARRAAHQQRQRLSRRPRSGRGRHHRRRHRRPPPRSRSAS